MILDLTYPEVGAEQIQNVRKLIVNAAEDRLQIHLKDNSIVNMYLEDVRTITITED